MVREGNNDESSSKARDAIGKAAAKLTVGVAKQNTTMRLQFPVHAKRPPLRPTRGGKCSEAPATLPLLAADPSTAPSKTNSGGQKTSQTITTPPTEHSEKAHALPPKKRARQESEQEEDDSSCTTEGSSSRASAVRRRGKSSELHANGNAAADSSSSTATPFSSSSKQGARPENQSTPTEKLSATSEVAGEHLDEGSEKPTAALICLTDEQMDEILHRMDKMTNDKKTCKITIHGVEIRYIMRTTAWQGDFFIFLPGFRRIRSRVQMAAVFEEMRACGGCPPPFSRAAFRLTGRSSKDKSAQPASHAKPAASASRAREAPGAQTPGISSAADPKLVKKGGAKQADVAKKPGRGGLPADEVEPAKSRADTKHRKKKNYLKDSLPTLVDGRDLVGARIRVWWDGDQTWFKGRVVKYQTGCPIETFERPHLVHYDDGEVRWHELEDKAVADPQGERDTWDFEPSYFREMVVSRLESLGSSAADIANSSRRKAATPAYAASPRVAVAEPAQSRVAEAPTETRQHRVDVEVKQLHSRSVKVIRQVGDWRWRSEEQWLVENSWLDSDDESEHEPEWMNRKRMEAALGVANSIRFLAKAMAVDLKRLHVPSPLPYGFRKCGATSDVVWFMLRLQLAIPWKACKKSFEDKVKRWTRRLMHLSKADTPLHVELTDVHILIELLLELGNGIREPSFCKAFDFKSWQAAVTQLEKTSTPEASCDERLGMQLRKDTRKVAGALHTKCEPSAVVTMQFMEQLMGLAKRLASGIRWEG